MASPILKPATKNDFINMYGMPCSKSLKGISAFIDGKIQAIGGIYYTNSGVFAFARINEEMRKYPLSIYKASRKIVEILKATDSNVYAVADPAIKRSDDLLMSMGFRFVNRIPNKGDLYEWTH